MYYFAKQHSPTYQLGDAPIYKILSDKRKQSQAYYSSIKEFKGNILVEVIFAGYENSKQQILVRPRFDLSLKFTLNIKDKKAFTLIRDKVFNKGRKPFVVFANWRKTEADILSQKQVVFPTTIG